MKRIAALLLLCTARLFAEEPPQKDRAECLRYLTLAENSANEIGDESRKTEIFDLLQSKKTDVWSQLAEAHAKAGDVAGANKIASTISLPTAKIRALVSIAAAQASFGDTPGAKVTAASISDATGMDKALVAIAEAQVKAGNFAEATITANEIKGAAGKASAWIVLGEAKAKAGDAAALKQKIEEAMALLASVPNNLEPERTEAYRRIAVAQTRAGDVAAAVATARAYGGHWSRPPLVEVIEAQVESGDIAGARETQRNAHFDQLGASRTLAILSNALVVAGKFPEAKAEAEKGGWYSDFRLATVASVEAKAGKLPDAKASANAILNLTAGDHKAYLVHYSRTVEVIAAAQAKIDGFSAAEQWLGAVIDPLARCLGYKALAAARFVPAALDYVPARAMRVFTDNNGRTMRATVLSVKGDTVNLKREDGQALSISASSLSKPDIAYLQQFGLQKAPSSAGNTKP